MARRGTAFYLSLGNSIGTIWLGKADWLIGAVDTAGTTGGQLFASNGTSVSNTLLTGEGASTVYPMSGLEIDSDNTGVMAAITILPEDLDVAMPINWKLFFYLNSSATTNNTVNFTLKYQLLNPGATQGSGTVMKQENATSFPTGFTTYTVSGTGSDDNMMRQLTGAIIPGGTFVGSNRGMPLVLLATPATGGSISDDVCSFYGLYGTYTRSMT